MRFPSYKKWSVSGNDALAKEEKTLLSSSQKNVTIKVININYTIKMTQLKHRNTFPQQNKWFDLLLFVNVNVDFLSGFSLSQCSG